MSKSALVCVTHNNCDTLIRCLESVFNNTSAPYHLFLIDNASSDPTPGLYTQLPSTATVVRNTANRWWAGGINQGIRLAGDDFDHVFFLNDDIEVPKRWLERLTNLLDSNPGIGAIGPLNSNPNDWQCYDRVRTEQDIGSLLPAAPEIDRRDLAAMDALVAGQNDPPGVTIQGMLAFFCTGLRREAVAKVGLLDEAFIMGGDDDDYCRRLTRAGFDLALALNTYVLHHGSVSINRMDDGVRAEFKRRNLARLAEKYAETSEAGA
ncbi:glycosyltransferase family 2 protein [Azospirillum rugosum]|uniref:GT2 family glycosyltransferase n=1 Tax=Azospirillum rugosum TaxID=416170 RepID=A0ABS4SWR3_9PROT|nr:glycosyltransferase family 2 protein [Azospirillum rugosum]MBP2296513.1 GT2 family glycosyltransferase [Azospirillum rugosum]MDQ0530087.1 GT2 family glycosyltransferase [Azospirillum rugosum]